MMVEGKLEGIASYAVIPDLMVEGNWDAPEIDALVQVAIFGDVIYG